MQTVWFNKTFSSVGTAISLIRQADTAGDYRIICSNTNAHASAFLAAHAAVVEPSGLDDQQYLDWCLAFCREQRVGIFWPGKKAGLIADHVALFEAQGTRVLGVASREVLRLLHDKARFCAGLDLPMAPPAQFRSVSNVDDYDAAYAELRPLHDKLCIKPSESVYGIGFAVIDEVRSSAQLLLAGAAYHVNAQDLRSGLAALGTFKPMLLMEYLAGHEYSADCVADHGVLVCAVPRKKPLSPGAGQLIELRSEILQACVQLARAYGLNGIFNVQFREGRNGLALLEINPRMSGGIGMACLAGPNLPYLALRGFDRGFDGLAVAPVNYGLRVGETAHALALP